MRARLGIVSIVVALAAVACAGGADGADGPGDGRSVAGSSSSQTDNRSAVKSGAPVAPDFTIPIARNDGGRLVTTDYSLSENRGKPAVLYFSFAG